MDKKLYREFFNTIYQFSNKLSSHSTENVKRTFTVPQSEKKLEELEADYDNYRNAVFDELKCLYNGTNFIEVKTVSEKYFDEIQRVTDVCLCHFPDYNHNEALLACAEKIMPGIGLRSFKEIAYWFIYSLTDTQDRLNEIVNEFSLPVIVVEDFEGIKQQLNKFESRFEKINFLERIIAQTGIDKAIKMCDADCLQFSKLLKEKPGWEGVFDAMHGDYKLERAINAEAYKAGVEHYKNYILLQDLLLKTREEKLPPQQTETKTDKLKAGLGKYGFFELPKVKQLSEPNKQHLVELISINPMPYGIAMFDYLGFCEYLDREQGTKYKADQILSRLYNNKAKDGTSAKHYRRSLIKPLPRYKAGEYKETVKTDYQKLK